MPVPCDGSGLPVPGGSGLPVPGGDPPVGWGMTVVGYAMLEVVWFKGIPEGLLGRYNAEVEANKAARIANEERILCVLRKLLDLKEEAKRKM